MILKDVQNKAKHGIEIIENAILELLENNTKLTNTEIANLLDLGSSHEGKQKDYLTYSILGNLMKKGIVYKDKSDSRPKYRLVNERKT